MNGFPQLRQDPIVDRRVLIAPERATRPMELVAAAAPRAAESSCPFCEGHETLTPHEVFAIRRPGTVPDSPGWHVRVVSNMFPAARPDAPAIVADDRFALEPGYGAHEVVIESPRHQTSLAELPLVAVRRVFEVFRARVAHLSRDPRLQYVQVFKNHGIAAGASVEHVHSQILGVSRVPREPAAELAGAGRFHRETGQCAYCDLIERERRAGVRWIAQNDGAVALAAYAGRFPYETWILPRAHSSAFAAVDDAALAAVADLIHRLLRRLAQIAPGIGYNLVLHSAPVHDAARPDYHWHWELLPRTTGIAGFELSTGWFLNPLPPESAAEQLRG